MKAVRPLLLGFAAAGSLLAADPADPPAAPTRLSEVIRASLPPYTPPPPKPKDTPGEATTTDPDVLQLPKMTVHERYQPRIVPDELLTGRVLQKKMNRQYLDSLDRISPLTRILNSFFIPLFSAPVSVRAREYYRQEQYRDMFDTIKAISAADPEKAAEMHREMVNMLAERPPGSK
jgi:hypothetical protein